MNSPSKQKTKAAGKAGVAKVPREILALQAFNNDNPNPKKKKIDSDDASVASSEASRSRKSKTKAEEKIKRGGNLEHKKLIDYDEFEEIQDFLKGLSTNDTSPKADTPKKIKMETEGESDIESFKKASKRLTQAAFGLFDKIELDFESVNHEREFTQEPLASKASEKIIKGSPKMEVEEAKENTKPKMIDLLKESLLDIYSDVHDNRLAKINFEPIAEIMRTTKQIDVEKVFPLIDESIKEQQIEEEEEEKESQAFVLQKVTLEHLDENHQKINELVQGISESDFQRLDPEVYLNDTLINFYLKFIELGLINRERRNKVHIFNTYFFSKMRTLFTDIASDFTKFEKVYEKLERWTRKIDLFQKDFILIPVNENEHWNMIVLCYPSKLYSKDMDFPFVIYLDSICRMDDVYAKMLYNFFVREVKAKRPNDFMTLQAKVYRLNMTSLPYYQPMVPKQSNWTDCGLYLLQYTELFAQDESYIVENKEELNKIKWFPRQLIMDKRDEMKRLIRDLKTLRYDVIKEYLDRRRRVMKENARDRDQYDYFDQRGFEKAVDNKYGDTNLTEEEIRILKLDYYYLDSLEYDQADNAHL